MHYDCLIIDDEEVLAQSTCEYFNLFDVQTAWTPDAPSTLAFLQTNQTDLILLDINLGNSSGFELCKQLRSKSNVPILFISARTSDDDMLLALNIGGDDYIQKPYSLSVLLAKVKAVLKRYRQTGESSHDKESPVSDEKHLPSALLSSGELTLNPSLERVSLNGQTIPLKAMEYKLLAYLVRHKNRIIPKEELFAQVWGDSITGDGTLNVHIRRLREKIEKDPNHPRHIKTVWGTGYVFEEKNP